MGPFVAVHVAIGGESLTTEGARERSFSGVNQHMTIERAKGRQHLAAQTAVVNFGLSGRIVGIGQRLHFIMSPNVSGELLLGRKSLRTERASVLLQRAPGRHGGGPAAVGAVLGLGAGRGGGDGGVVLAFRAGPVAQGGGGAVMGGRPRRRRGSSGCRRSGRRSRSCG